MFASTELAERLEREQARLMRAYTESAAAHGASDVLIHPICGGLATCAGPVSPLNKVAGLGFGGVPTAEQLDALEAEYARRGASPSFEISTLANPEIAKKLTRRGYVLVGFESVLARALTDELHADELEPDASIQIERLGDGPQPDWVDTLVTGFQTPDGQGAPAHETFEREALVQVVAATTSATGVARYIATIDGQIAGGGCVWIANGLAQLGGASTLPEFRRRGVQTALLARRLKDAREEGCDLAAMMTTPGSKSMQNAVKRGFVALYARAVLTRDG